MKAVKAHYGFFLFPLVKIPDRVLERAYKGAKEKPTPCKNHQVAGSAGATGSIQFPLRSISARIKSRI